MDKPEGWTPEWQAALVKANLEVPYFRVGLTAYQFAELAGVSEGAVYKYARLGLEDFKKRFGNGCGFEDKPSNRKLVKKVFTFHGCILFPANKPPCSNVIPASEFAKLHKINDISSLASLARRGHTWFRNRFPGWDFLEIHATGQMCRWYGKIEHIGLQKEEPLPEDNLTLTQFARLKGLCESGVKFVIKRDLQVFLQQYPGWAFRYEGQRPIFYRIGDEPAELLTIPQFAHRMGRSVSFIQSLIKESGFNNTFPDWEVQLTGIKRPKWHILRTNSVNDS